MSSNESIAASLGRTNDRAVPIQLDMFSPHNVPVVSSTYTRFALACLPDAASVSVEPIPDPARLESENWRVQELMDDGSWSDIQKLEAARAELHEEVFECSGIELNEVRRALRDVASRIRELAH